MVRLPFPGTEDGLVVNGDVHLVVAYLHLQGD